MMGKLMVFAILLMTSIVPTISMFPLTSGNLKDMSAILQSSYKNGFPKQPELESRMQQTVASFRQLFDRSQVGDDIGRLSERIERRFDGLRRKLVDTRLDQDWARLGDKTRADLLQLKSRLSDNWSEFKASLARKLRPVLDELVAETVAAAATSGGGGQTAGGGGDDIGGTEKDKEIGRKVFEYTARFRPVFYLQQHLQRRRV